MTINTDNIDFKNIEIIFRNWADSKCIIRRAWLFGSAIKNTFNEKSDLDIAIEHIASTKIVLDVSIWENELHDLIDKKMNRLIKVHISNYDGLNTPKVHKGLNDGSIKIYESLLPTGIEDTGPNIDL